LPLEPDVALDLQMAFRLVVYMSFDGRAQPVQADHGQNGNDACNDGSENADANHGLAVFHFECLPYALAGLSVCCEEF